MFANPQGAKKESNKAKAKKDQKEAVQLLPNPANATFRATVVGHFGAWLGGNLGKIDEDKREPVYKVHLVLLNIRVSQKETDESLHYELQAWPEDQAKLDFEVYVQLALEVAGSWLSVYTDISDMKVSDFKEVARDLDREIIQHLVEIVETVFLNGIPDTSLEEGELGEDGLAVIVPGLPDEGDPLEQVGADPMEIISKADVPPDESNSHQEDEASKGGDVGGAHKRPRN